MKVGKEEKKMIEYDISGKMCLKAKELGEYMENNQGLIKRSESLVIAIKGIMHKLEYDTRSEKEEILNQAVDKYLEEE